MFKNKVKPETTVTKKPEHTEVEMCWNIFENTQNSLMGKNDEFKRNYLLALKTITMDTNQVTVRRIIDGSQADSIAVKSIYQRSRDLFEYFIRENILVTISSLTSMTYDFVSNKLNFSESQLEIFRAKFYASDVIIFNPFGPNGRGSNDLFNCMLNQINRRILMVLDVKDEEPNINELNKAISALGFESIVMNYANSFVLDLYDYFFCNLMSIAAFDPETISKDKYPMLLNFIDSFLNDTCAEIKKVFINTIYEAMQPYLTDQEFAIMLCKVSNSMGPLNFYSGYTVNVYPEPGEERQHKSKDLGYDF